jgi:diguanylate cyclase (GGDEF)-like protein/PAS domain S-box-containing protein
MLRWFDTLKFKIVALAVTSGVVAALASAHMVLQTTREDMRQMLLAEQRQERMATAALLGSKLDTLRSSLQAVARRTSVEDWSDEAGLQRYVEGLTATHVLFDSVALARPDGRVIARWARNGGSVRSASLAERSYFQQALRTDQPVVSSPIRSLLDGEPLVAIAAVAQSADGTPLGIVMGGLALRSTRLFAEMASNADLGVRNMVMDREGLIVAHSDSRRVLGRAAEETGFATVYARWFSDGRPIDTDGLTEFSQDHVVAMAGIPTSDWVLVSLTTESSAMHPVIAAQRTGGWSALAVGVAVSLLAGLAAWWLTRPISQLRERAQALLDSPDPAAVAWPRLSGELGGLAAAFRRVVEQRAQRDTQTQALLQQLVAVVTHVDIGIALTREGHFELVSPRLCELFGMHASDMLHQPTDILHASAEDFEAFIARCGPAFAADGSFDGEVQLLRRSGERFWAHMRGRSIVRGDRSKGTIWTVQDVSHARAHREELEWTSNHDAMTGLANRKAFDALLARCTTMAATDPFCALFIDLDRFKEVNDTSGHAAGDALLQGIASRLVAHVRQSDTVARLGGDEFAVLLHRCTREQAITVAENLRMAVHTYQLHWEGRDHAVGASIGMVVVNARFTDAAAVMRAADAACYSAKQRGRNAVVVHEG